VKESNRGAATATPFSAALSEKIDGSHEVVRSGNGDVADALTSVIVNDVPLATVANLEPHAVAMPAVILRSRVD